MITSISQRVDDILKTLDDNDPILRGFCENIFRPFPYWTYGDMVALGVINRAMSLIYGFTTLVRSKNYLTAQHLIRLHLDNLLRFSALFIRDEDAEPLAKRIYEGEQLNHIEYEPGQRYSDNFLAKMATTVIPWIKELYEETSGFIHLSDVHIFNSTEAMDDDQQMVGLHASKYDQRVTDEGRLQGIEKMQKITVIVCNLLESWRERKVKKTSGEGANIIPEEYRIKIFVPIKPFTYVYQDKTYNSEVLCYQKDGNRRYRAAINAKDNVIILPMQVGDDLARLVWIQELRNGIVEHPHDLIQAMGEGIEKADWWVDPIPPSPSIGIGDVV